MPLETPAGDAVHLSFRVAWSVPAGNAAHISFHDPEPPDPPDPPAPTYLRCTAALPWGHRPRRLRAVRAVWSGVPRVRNETEFVSSQAPRADADELRASWRKVARQSNDAGLRWGRAPRADADAVEALWRQIPRRRTEADLPWESGLPRHVTSADAPWRDADARDHAIDLPWATRARQRHDAQIPWTHPPRADARQRWPWGHGKKVPWFVGSPGPEPEPPSPPYVHPVPPGAVVHLSFRCPAVASVLPASAIRLSFGRAQCFVAWPRPRRYVVLNTASVVRLPERTEIHVVAGRISSAIDSVHRSFDLALADPAQLGYLLPGASGAPKFVEINVNGYIFIAQIEAWDRNRRHLKDGGSGEVVSVRGRSLTALLGDPFAPTRAHVWAGAGTRAAQQLIDDEIAANVLFGDASADTFFSAGVPEDWSWNVPSGVWHYDGLTPVAAMVRVVEAAGALLIAHRRAGIAFATASVAHPTGEVTLPMGEHDFIVRPRYPVSPWAWSATAADVQIHDDVILDARFDAGSGERGRESVSIPLWPPSASDKPRLVEPFDLVEIVEPVSRKALATGVEIAFRTERAGNGAAVLIVEQSITLDPAPAVPLYDQVVVSGAYAGVSNTIRRTGRAGDTPLPAIIDPLITTDGVSAERGRNAIAAGSAARARNNLWLALTGLMPDAPQRRGTVTAVNGDDNYSLTTDDGGTVRVRARPGDTWAVLDVVFYRAGVIVDAAPGLAGGGVIGV